MTTEPEQRSDSGGNTPSHERRSTPRADLSDHLRERAEEHLAVHPVAQAFEHQSPEAIIHELEVHQVELEMQNEALRQSQEEIQEALDRYADLYDRAPVGYVTLDSAGVMLQANLTLAKMLGRERASLIGGHLIRFVTMEDRDTCYLHRRQLFRTGEAQTDEVRLERPDGTQIWVRLDGIMITVPDEPPAARIILTDITERKALDEELRRQERQAAVAQLTSGLAEEFRDALASVYLYSQWTLADPTASADTRQALRAIHDESRRASDIVEKMLDYSRRAILEPADHDLSRLVAAYLPEVRNALPEEIELRTALSQEPCPVRVDPLRIRQVVVNLVRNAEEAVAGHGNITIEVDCATEVPYAEAGAGAADATAWVRLAISDTGGGLSREATEHLFEPFFTTKTGRGRGLGLAQAQGIVRLHGGIIDVETTAGHGTTVRVYLPLVADGEGEGDGADDRRTAPGESGSEGSPEITVLVVEQMADLRDAIRAVLASLGCRVLAAPNEQAALEMAVRRDVDLLLNDVSTLGGEHLLLRELRERSPSIKATAIATHRSDVDTAALHDAGYDAVVLKPFAIEDLAATVRATLGLRE